MNRSKLDTLFDMSGRVVIVTGGTRGIGLALAEGYAANYADLVDSASISADFSAMDDGDTCAI
jgi:NAD(P)-dependent dehydrogenase (short-subunit alcohol dehydrogenase family)